MRKKLTKTQKRKNKTLYKRIRNAYDDVKYKNPDISYKQFKNRVMAQKEANPSISWKEAIKKETRTETFFTAAERSRENLINKLKSEFANEYKEIRNLSRTDTGKYKALTLVWDKDRNGYTFTGKGGKTYFIDITNSPEEVLVYEI